MRRTRSLVFVADLHPVDSSRRGPDDENDEYRLTTASITASLAVSATCADSMTMSTGRCLSVGDLLTTSGGTLCAGESNGGVNDPLVVLDGAAIDDLESSWCSVDNLETDCVSPRVSTNSLFSQVDGLASGPMGSGNSPACWDDSFHEHLTLPVGACGGALPAVVSCSESTASGCALDVTDSVGSGDYAHGFPVFYSKPANRRRGQLSDNTDPSVVSPMLYRQMTVGYRVNGTAGPLLCGLRGASMRSRRLSAASRSISCPSIVTSCSFIQPEEYAVVESIAIADNGGRQDVADESKHRISDVDVDKGETSTSTPCQTLTAVSMVSSSRSSRSASPLSRGAPRMSKSTREHVAAGGISDSSTWRCRRTPGSSWGKMTSSSDASKETGNGSGGINSCQQRVSRSLAQTKCLQWLNSFDEDD